VLICAATHDTVASAYPIGHFDIYHGAAQSQAISDRIEFLDRTVTGKAAL
jgi:hypothetical protein